MLSVILLTGSGLMLLKKFVDMEELILASLRLASMGMSFMNLSQQTLQ